MFISIEISSKIGIMELGASYMKKFLVIFLCGILLLCISACKETNINDNTQSIESIDQNDTNNQATAIFVTKNIKRITFYACYGNGKGSDVPAEHLNEIITWLDSFTIDEEAPELVPPGTNTINVEIEYMDGTVVKKGLDMTTVDGIAYYIKGDTAPECYNEIISKVSLN